MATRLHRLGGFTLLEGAVLLATMALLVVLAVPALAQMRGDDWTAVTRDHLRQYARVHLVYVADHDVLPPLLGSDDDLNNNWSVEVGLFSTNHNGLVIDLDEGVLKIMNGFVDGYVADPAIFTSPADTMARATEPGYGSGRMGHLLTPDEDPQAVGATFTRLWFGADDDPQAPAPRDYRTVDRRFHVQLGGLMESHVMTLTRADMIQSPSDSADLVEEDEDSRLDNSMFDLAVSDWQAPPFEPGTSNVITDRHSGEGGHVSYHDGHVELLTDVINRYWAQPNYAERLRLLWRTAP